jgi:hypothetical protein
MKDGKKNVCIESTIPGYATARESKDKFYDPIVAEVRQNRAKLLEMYGGIEGLNRYLEDEQPQLEGWHFATPEELAALKQHHRTVEEQGVT